MIMIIMIMIMIIMIMKMIIMIISNISFLNMELYFCVHSHKNEWVK